jgi:hypothetical protein
MMHKPSAVGLVLLVGLAILTLPAIAAPLPATLAKALEGAELDTKDGWAFRQTLKAEAMGKPAVTSVTRWDPSKPEGQQCTVVSLEVKGDDKARAKEEDPCGEGHERETYGDLVALVDDAIVESISESDTFAEYRLTPRNATRGFSMGGLHVDVGNDQDSKNLTGTLRVVKTGAGAPYVERVAFRLREPEGNLIAKLSKLDIVYTYSPDAATGAKLLRGMELQMELTMLTAFDITTQVSARFDEYRSLR